MKHFLTITGDNYNEVIEHIASMYKKGVFNYFVLDKGERDNIKLSLLANVIINSDNEDKYSPFNNHEKNGDYCVFADDNDVIYVYTKKDMKCVDRYPHIEENIGIGIPGGNFFGYNDQKYINLNPIVQDEYKDNIKINKINNINNIDYNFDYLIANKILKMFMENNNKLMNAITIATKIDVNGSIDKLLDKMVEKGMLQSVYFNSEKCYQMKINNLTKKDYTLNTNIDDIIKKKFDIKQKKVFYDLNEIDQDIVRMFAAYNNTAMDKDTIGKNTNIKGTIDISLNNLVDKGLLLVGNYVKGNDLKRVYCLNIKS